MLKLTLDRPRGPVPLTIHATLEHADVTEWRWCVGDKLHKPDNGDTHTFVFDQPGEWLVGVRGVTANGTIELSNIYLVQAKPALPAPSFVGLQTFGLIPEEWAEALAAKGWGRVRVEGQASAAVMAQCQRHTLWPLWVLKSAEDAAAAPSGTDVEILNEPNLAGYSPAAYQAFVWSVLPGLLVKGCTVYAGCVSNQSKADHAWLKAALAGLPDSVRASGHRYPDANQDPTKPKKGYPTRDAELRGWREAIGGRRFAITEIGFHTAPYRTGWWWWTKRGQRTEEEVARFLTREVAVWKAAGADFVTVYQLNDGPSTDWMDRYGIRTVDGRWKAAAALPTLV